MVFICTAISYQNGDTYFGRNLDLERGYGEKVVITGFMSGFSLGSAYLNFMVQDIVAADEVTGGETGGEQGSAANLASAKTLDFSSTAQRTVFNENQQVWTDGSVTLTNDKAASATNVADYSNPVRLYKDSTITISSSAGKFNKIVITSANYADRIAALTDTLTAANLTFTVNEAVFTITFAEAIDTTTAISLANQCRLVSIVVSYE